MSIIGACYNICYESNEMIIYNSQQIIKSIYIGGDIDVIKLMRQFALDIQKDNNNKIIEIESGGGYLENHYIYVFERKNNIVYIHEINCDEPKTVVCEMNIPMFLTMVKERCDSLIMD